MKYRPFPQALHFKRIALTVAWTLLAQLLVFQGTAKAVDDTFVWFNPPAGTSTSPGSFIPNWTTTSDGTARILQTDYTYSTNSCGTTWTDSGLATRNETVTVVANKCYKWTFDSDISANAVAPSLSGVAKSALTSGVLKVYNASCRMVSTWDRDTVTVTYNIANTTSGIDCRTEFLTPRNVGAVDFLLVGGGGAGGWASESISQGGGGGGGGGMSFSRTNASVTPGRTYSIEVGAGAVVGASSNNTITCRRGVVGASETTTVSFGGTSKLGSFNAEGGGCARNTGGEERGSDGGISANGRTGGRGGSRAYRTTSGSRITLDTTTFYTTAPTMSDTLTALAGSFGDGSTAANVTGLQAWEGGGGGGGASFTEGTRDFACSYASDRYRIVDGCDGIDIAGRGAMGGIGGSGIQSWYEGVCNFYFGGGGGGGGSTGTGTVLETTGDSYFGLRVGNRLFTYAWDGSKTVPTARTGNNIAAVRWAPLGGPGGLGGGGQAATSITNIDSITVSDTATYQNAQAGTHGCGGGGGGGQAYKSGVQSYDSNADNRGANLNRPGQGGNGIGVIRFRVAGANYSTAFNPDIRISNVIKINPLNKNTLISTKLLNTSGSGFICFDVASPSDSSTVYSGSNVRFVSQSTSYASFTDSGTVNSLQSRLNALAVSNNTSRYLLNNSDAWLSSYQLNILIRYSGSDSIANNTCSNSTADLPYGSSTLIRNVIIERLPVTSIRRLNLPLVNGKQS